MIRIQIVVYLEVSLVRKRLLPNTHVTRWWEPRKVLKTRTPAYMWTDFMCLCAKEVACDCLALRYKAIFPTEFQSGTHLLLLKQRCSYCFGDGNHGVLEMET